MHTVGDNTRDHITLGTEHPAETGLPTGDREHTLQRYSTRALVWGASILIGTYLVTFAAKTAVGDDKLFEHPTAQVFATIGFITLHTLGNALILIAGLERITRPMRTWIRHAITLLVTLQRTSEQTVVKLASAERRLTGLEAAVSAVPDFAVGFDRGARVTAAALGLDDRS